jgi:ribokinase
MRAAVVGHIEWVTFARVPTLPDPGEIVHATEVFEQPAGGGGTAALALHEIAGDATLFTVLGDDDLGSRAASILRERGIDVRAMHRGETRRAFTHIDGSHERTITVLGDRHVPDGSDDIGWEDLADFDAVYVAGGEPETIALARAARILVVSARLLPALRASQLPIDALIGSATDGSERYAMGDLDPDPTMVVRTEGRAGGTVETADGLTRYSAAPEPSEISDTYGCGDRFAVAFTYALATGNDDPAAFAAAAAAEALTRRGAGA